LYLRFYRYYFLSKNSKMFSIKIKDILQTKPVVKENPKIIYEGFKLPITYVESKYIHALSPQVSEDLELSGTDLSGNMYSHILTPNHQFAKNIQHEWSKQYTTSIPFLQDTQQVLKAMPGYLEQTRPNVINCDKVMEIWKDTKSDAGFLEKYSYIEWDAFKYLNESPMFLQTISVINMSSPILSFIIPVIFFIFPFVLLKLQGVPITFSTYISVLKDVARHHFIGNVIQNIQSISWEKLAYLLITAGLYVLQIYQNYNLCVRFYKNLNKINTHLCDLRDHITHSIANMSAFNSLNMGLDTYRTFCNVTREKCATLSSFNEELSSIKPFKAGFSKIAEIGYMLKCFYRLHANPEYEDALRYSVGFEGYMNNMTGISENISLGNLSYATYSNDSKCEFTQQYYPAYVKGKYVRNNCDLSKNIVITGPNASGKTTILKTTALNIIFTQQFGVGFYKSCILKPYTHVHSYLNIPDTSGRDSLFQAESRRCKDIIDIINAPDNATSRHFCIYDELYSGTNPSEAINSAHAFLLYLCDKQNVDFMLTTHYVSLCKKLRTTSRIKNYKMDVDMTDGVRYTYNMRKGISRVKGGILILEEMKYPSEILDMIRKF
jgi:energy-coupling factor transporter ATP-binding protein EcfA2